MYFHENVQIHLRTAEWNQLKWPALWAGFGLVCSTAGSIIGLYLPASA
jgi:hypothetical protein